MIKIKKRWIIFFAIAIFILVFSLWPIYPNMSSMEASGKVSIADILGMKFWIFYVVMIAIYAVTTFITTKNKK